MKTYDATLELATVQGDGLRFDCAAGDLRMTLDSGDGARAPSPVQAVLMALGACGGMDIISMLRKGRQDVTGYRIALRANRRDEHPRTFTEIEVVHHVRGRAIKASAVARAIELSDTKYCSVHAMLEPSVAISSRFEIEEDSEAPSASASS